MKTTFKRKNNRPSDTAYRLLFLCCFLVAELIALAAFTWWPEPAETEEQPFFIAPDALFISPEEIDVTRHKAGVPPPPKPRIPNPVPNDRVVDQQIELPDIVVSESLLEGIGTLGNMPEADGNGVISNPGRAASVIKIVEPVFPKEAQEAKLSAVISVTFLVRADGSVEDVFVNEIRQYTAEGQYTVTRKIGFGLVEVTLEAASKWKFRPARHNGQPVKAYVKHEFTFGR